MDIIVQLLQQWGFELLAVLWGSIILPFIIKALKNYRDKNDSAIIQNVIDTAVEYAEAELVGSRGREKFEKAVTTSMDMIGERYPKMKVSEKVIRQSVQSGYNRMKNNGNEIKSGGSSDVKAVG